MNDSTRRQLELAARVKAFAQQYPSEDTAYAPIVARITEVGDRLATLHGEQLAGMEMAKTATARLAELRLILVTDLVRHVAQVAEVAQRSGAKLSTVSRGLRNDAPLMAILAEAQQVLARLVVDEAVLRPFGLSATLVARLTATTAEFEQLLTERASARNTHVGARREYEAAKVEFRAVISLLDGFNRLRFAKTSSELGEWDRLKRLLGAPKRKSEPEVADPDVTPIA